jgi:hypothetical protein
MAKKQLKKVNQPKKYLQGGSNMGSVAQMKQTPYYLGQVEANQAQDQLEASTNALARTRMQELENKRVAEEQVKEQNDQFAKNSAQSLLDAGIEDRKTGDLGRFFRRGAPGITPGVTKMTEVAATNALPYAYNTGAVVAPTASTAGLQTISTAASPATQMVVGQAAPTMSTVGQAVTGSANVADVGAAASTATKAGLSSAATAGIGIGLTAAGMITERKTDDKTDFYNNQRERRGNVAGEALKAAGTVTPLALNPAVLAATSGLSALAIPVAAGVGALKGRKENKANTELAQNLQRDSAAQRGAYQSAFINSRLGSADPGYAYAGSDTQNLFTNAYQVARTGGVTSIQEDRRTKYIPGGKIVPIEGTDAVEYVGRSHEEGGMFPEAKKQGGKIKDKGSIEVEGGETEDQVIMEDNNKKDYIFSKYLKLGGKSFAQRHKEILKGNGSQAEIQQLAAMQEKMAGRNPQQIARYGGIHKYVDGGVTDPPQNTPGSGSYQQVGKFGAPDLTNAKLITVNGPSGSRYQVYQFPDGSTYDPNNMNQKIQSVQREGAEVEGALFAAPGAIAQGVTSGLAGAARLGYNMINDKALPSGSSGSTRALPSGNTSAVGNYGGNVFAAKPQTESFNVFGNYPAMIKQAAALSASGAQPQSGSSATYTGPTGQGEGQQYFNNIGQGQGQGQSQSDPYNTAANARAMGWGDDVEGYIRSEFGFGPNYKAPSTPSKGSTKKSKPAYDREAWRKQGVGLMTDEELAAAGPMDSIPDGAQYRRPPGATPPPVASAQGTATGSTGYMAPAGVAGSAPNAQAGPVTTAGQTIVSSTAPSNAPAGAQSAVSSQTVTGTGTPAAGTTTTGTPTSGTQTAAGTDRFYTKTDEGQKGRSVAIEKVPQGQRQKDGYYGSASETDFQAMVKNNPWFDFTGFNPKSKTDVSRFQTEFNKRVGQGFTLKVDGKLGEQTRTAALYMNDPAKPTTGGATTSGTTPTDTGTTAVDAGTTTQTTQNTTDTKIPYKPGKALNGAMLAGFGQLIPMGAALLNPYKIAAPIAGTPGIKGSLMPRVNLNPERDAATKNAVAMRNAVINQNAGPGSLAVLQGANNALNEQMLKIANQEKDANKGLLAQEGENQMKASMFNAETEQKRQMFNTELNKDERRYSREDKLGALDAAMRGVAGVVTDNLKYKATERLANAMDETHSYERLKVLEDLRKQSKNKKSPYYGMNDTELRKMAAQYSKELFPEGYVSRIDYEKIQAELEKAKKEKETPKAKMGGARQYVSRLGDLKNVRGLQAKK